MFYPRCSYDKAIQRNHLSPMCHFRQLVDKSSRLFSNNFIIHGRMLYKNCYWFVACCHLLIKVMTMIMMIFLVVHRLSIVEVCFAVE